MKDGKNKEQKGNAKVIKSSETHFNEWFRVAHREKVCWKLRRYVCQHLRGCAMDEVGGDGEAIPPRNQAGMEVSS